MPYKDYSNMMNGINDRAQDSAMNSLGAFLTVGMLGGAAGRRSAGPSAESRIYDQSRATQVQQEINRGAREDARAGRIDRLLTGQGAENDLLEAARRAQGLAIGLDEKRRESLSGQIASMMALQAPGAIDPNIQNRFMVAQGGDYGDTMEGQRATLNAAREQALAVQAMKPVTVNEMSNVYLPQDLQTRTGLPQQLTGNVSAAPGERVALTPGAAKNLSIPVPQGVAPQMAPPAALMSPEVQAGGMPPTQGAPAIFEGAPKPASEGKAFNVFDPVEKRMIMTYDGLTDIHGNVIPPENGAYKSTVNLKVDDLTALEGNPLMHAKFEGSDKLKELVSANANVQRQVVSLLQMIEDDETIVGASGTLQTLADSAGSQFANFVKIAGPDYRPTADFDLGSFNANSDSAGTLAAVYNSSLTQFAYDLAKSNSPSGRVSNQDFEKALSMVGGGLFSSAKHSKAVLRKKYHEARGGYARALRGLERKAPEQTAMPPHLGGPAPQSVIDYSGMSTDNLVQAWHDGDNSQQIRREIAKRQKAERGL